jgi:hypothetical protein
MDEAEKSRRVYVSAITCREVLIEANGVPSAFRIADRVETAPFTATRDLTNGEPDPNELHAIFAPMELRAVITFHSEQATKFVLSVKQKRPDGSYVEASPTKQMEIIEPGRGVMLNTTVAIATTFDGVHWIEFWIDGQPINKTPITITHPPELKDHRKWTREEWDRHFAEVLLQSAKDQTE